MDTSRRILLALLIPLFLGLLFVLALDVGVTQTFGNSDNVKKVLAKSGLYNSLVPNLLKQQGNIETAAGTIPTTDPLVQQAATKALTPAEVQQKSEAAIDSIYAWLDSKTAQPDFSLSFTPSKAALADSLANSVQAKLSTVPACTTFYTSTVFDPLNATCLPPGVSSVSAANNLRNQINGATIESASFKASDLKSDSAPNQTAFQDQFKDIPKLYQRAKKAPVVLTILVVLTAAAMVTLRGNWRAGLRQVGLLTLVLGVFMLAFAFVFNSAIKSKAATGVNTDNKVLQQNLKDAAKDLASDVNKNYIRFGVIYIVASGLALATALAVKKDGQPAAAAEEAPENDQPSEPRPGKPKKD
jgi:hypothetical protein